MEDSEMPDVVPAELCGKWIAWDENALHIVAAGDSMQEAIDKAKILGVTEPYLEKVPPAYHAPMSICGNYLFRNEPFRVTP